MKKIPIWGRIMHRKTVDYTAITFVVVLALFQITQGVSGAQDGASEVDLFKESLIALEVQNRVKPYGELVPSEERDLWSQTLRVSAYNSVPWQTDATPCISASGHNICDVYDTGVRVCAANFVPLGTQLYVDGLGTCTVLDRMNARYPNRVDWYMRQDVEGARRFGVRTKVVTRLP